MCKSYFSKVQLQDVGNTALKLFTKNNWTGPKCENNNLLFNMKSELESINLEVITQSSLRLKNTP